MNKSAILAILIGVIFIGSAGAYYAVDYVLEEPVDWEVTLIGADGTQTVVTYHDILDLPYQDARGGYFTTVGTVYGPYEVRGVLLQDVCDLVGGVSTNSFVCVNAPDGYSMAFGYEQIYGDTFQTWEPENMTEVPCETQMIMLTYRWDGKQVCYNDGGPLRLAIVTNERLLTEGSNWVKWVDEIEIKTLD